MHLEVECRSAEGSLTTIARAAFPTRPGGLPGDPPAPLIDLAATRTLMLLEHADAGPHLGPDGALGLRHPKRLTAEERAAVQLHMAGITALLTYRAMLEELWPVTAEPLPPPTVRG